MAHHVYKTIFLDSKDGEGSTINPRSIIRWVKKAEVPWSDIRFKLKSQKHQVFDKWVGKIMNDPEAMEVFNKIGITKALNLTWDVPLTSNLRT